MDGKTLIVIALAAGLALWLGVMLGQQQSAIGYVGPVGPGEADTGDTGTVGQIPNPGGMMWT